MREIIAWKRDNSADDLLTALIAAEHDGDQLTDDELGGAGAAAPRGAAALPIAV